MPSSSRGLTTSLMRALRRLLLASTALFASGTAFAADTMDNAYWNMPKGVTDISQEVFRLHMIAFWVCIAIGVVVFGVMFYSLFAFRRSKHPVPMQFHESTTIEIIWTIIPFVILIGLAVPAAGTLIREYDTRNSDLTVKITGYQWEWQYEYVGQGVSFFSKLKADANAARQLHSGIDPRTVPNYLHDVDHYLVLPVGKKVRFLLTANDVIHGWWMPDLAIKKDAIPGYINEMWTDIKEPGIFRGQCTVLCGRDHGFMPIVVDARPEADFESWLAQAKTTMVAQNDGTATDATPAPDQPATPPTQSPAPAPTESPNDTAPATSPNPAPPATAPNTGAPATPPSSSAAVPPTQVASAASAAKPSAAKSSKDDLVKAGAKVYAANCQVCHQAAGTGLPPTFPSLVNDKVVNGPVEGHINQILKGKNAMPPFQQLSDSDVAAVATYERNSWGNHAIEVQPAQVTSQRGK